MASYGCEELEIDFCDDDEVRQMEELAINRDLLMSLMEESPSDESDDDRLDSLIKSFEAEIIGSKMEDHDSASTGSELVSNNGEDMYTQSWNIGVQTDGQDYWDSSCEFGLECIGMDLMPSSPCNDGSWCTDPYGDGNKDGIAEFLNVGGNNLKVYDGFALGVNGYNSFRQDSSNLVTCD